MAANVQSRFVRGNAIFTQDHLKRVVEAYGKDVIKYDNHFITNPLSTNALDWVVTAVNTSTLTTVAPSLLRITTDGLENDGVSAQLRSEAFKLSSSQSLVYFGAFGVNMDEATQSDLFLGLAITDTAILGGVTDRIGFEKLDGSTDLKFVLEKDSTQTLSAAIATVADATDVDLEFYFDGSGVEVFVNGSSVLTPATTNLPDDEQLTVSFEFLTGEASAHTCDIDRIACYQVG